MSSPDRAIVAGLPRLDRGRSVGKLLDAISAQDDEGFNAALQDPTIDVNGTRHFKEPPLFYAAMVNRPDYIDRLIDCGATEKYMNDLGRTALHVAAEHGSDSACLRLLERGFDPALADGFGMSAIALALARQKASTHALLCAGKAREEMRLAAAALECAATALPDGW